MARMRTVKAGLRGSLTAAAWPRDARYLFVLLWGWLDDGGRGEDQPRKIRGECLPYDDDVNDDTVDYWLGLMCLPGPDGEPALCRYEVEGRRYLHAIKWAKHQKPQHPKPSEYPPCSVDHAQPLERDATPTVPLTTCHEADVKPTVPLTPVLSTGTENLRTDTASPRVRMNAQPEAANEGANTLVAEWLERCPERPPKSVVGQVAKTLGNLLGEGIAYRHVKQGLVDWHHAAQDGRGMHPATLPSFVHAAMSATAGRARASPKPRVEHLLNGQPAELQDLFRKVP